MKKYIELKIRTVYLAIINVMLVVCCSAVGYYIWCSYHPVIDISIVDGGKGEDIKVETPSVTVGSRHGIDTASSVELKIRDFWTQYNNINEYVINTYKAADIKLNIDVKDKQTILKYSGTATSFNDQNMVFVREIVLDFILDAKTENYN